MTKLPLIVAALALAATPALAQNTRVLPSTGQGAMGRSSTAAVFGHQAFRAQQVYDGASLAATSASISQIAFRYDATAATAGTVPNVTVKLSHTSVTPATMGTNFAGNVTATETTVFTGSVNLPAETVPQHGVAPFSVQIPIATPFNFTVASGNLLMDITAANATPSTPLSYTLDCALTGGYVETIGTDGPNTFNFSAGVSGLNYNTATLRPGGSIQFNANCGSWVSPVGADALGFAQLAQPIDLTSVGMPGHTMYLDPTYIVYYQPFNWQMSFIDNFSTWTMPIPNWSHLLGAVLFCQSYALEPSANAYGAVTSSCKRIVIGDTTIKQTQLLTSLDPVATDGSLPMGSSTGGLVTRFSGTIN